MITELFIENERLDITADISSLLTFAIDDVKDFSSRQTTFSKTIVLPGTDNNNKIFGGIFETGINNDYDSNINNVGINFNAAKSARAIIFQDFFQTFKGTVRLLEVVKDKGRIEYDIALNGELTGLNVALSNKYLEDLDFSTYDHQYSLTNITTSWDNAGGSSYYYPLIDYGNYSVGKHDWDYRAFRPALYVKEYIDKVFSNAGFRYSCDLFNTTRFKKLIIPHNKKFLTVKKTQLFKGTTSADITTFSADITDINFNTQAGTGFSTNMANTEFTYLGTPTTLKIDYNFSFRKLFTSGSYLIHLALYNNGTEIINLSSSNTNFNPNGTVNVTVNTSDVITWKCFATPEAFPSFILYHGSYFNASSEAAVPVPISLGDDVSINDTIPKNIKQIDFLLSIVRLFNLYLYEDSFDERKIKIAPFVDYYAAESSEILDWTYKLNLDQPIRIKPMSEINFKTYEFSYKEDNDFWNELYKKRYNQIYGSEIYDSEFEFSSQKTKLELIFAPTPLIGYSGEEKIYPTIYKKTGTTEEQTDCVIRIMQSKKITGVTSWDIKDAASVLGSYTVYPYAGHFDDPDSPDNDLNFGIVEELFFTLVSGVLNRTQFNLYWSAYMTEITDKDSKLLTAKFYLTAKDIFTLNFANYISIEGVLYRLNKIIDYNITMPGECTVELLKVIATSYGYPVGSFDTGIERFLLWNDTEPLIDSDNVEMLYI